jgi:transcriptional regulator with PAS, ATPase and Fis domain
MERETQFIGQSAAFQDAVERASLAASLDRPVLVIGERGTGKELIAERLHRLSTRWDRPYVIMNCAAMPETLIESELFGHEAGAFTGATRTRAGRFEEADGGTLFLDEIGNVPLHLQPKLLTALEQRQVVPVGANKPVDFDIRVVAATNLSPAALSDDQRFRQDLLFRLNTVEIELPPLRDRPEDVRLLAQNFLTQYARKYGKPERELPDHVASGLEGHDWPGNVRALRHSCERAVILADGDTYSLDDFSLGQRTRRTADSGPVAAAAPAPAPATDNLNLERAEKQMVEQALKKHHYNISLAAQELGLTRASLYRRMDKHGL